MMTENGFDDLTRRRIAKHVEKMKDELANEIDKLLTQHPLDSLLDSMLQHNWSEDDPMVILVREAMKVPYPMSRIEAIDRGLLPRPPGLPED